MVEHQQVAELDKCVLFYGLTKTTSTINASGRIFLRLMVNMTRSSARKVG